MKFPGLSCYPKYTCRVSN